MKYNVLLVFTVVVLLIISCKPSENVSGNIELKPVDIGVAADSLTEKAPIIRKTDWINSYRASKTKEWELIHTELRLQFDWDKRQVIGKAVLTLSPWFYTTDTLKIDAKGFDIKQVKQYQNTDACHYDYDMRQLFIRFDKKWNKQDTLKLLIEYRATPHKAAERGGGEDFSTDYGLYFVQKNGIQQIWTQGETEYNSYWFPTIDAPNQKHSQDFYLRVKQEHVSLSNGNLINSLIHTDGTRTDYWRLDQKHASYLSMIAVGNFKLVRDYWRDVPVNYYLEPDYAQYAKDIFGKTPQMIEFFSRKFKITYPWKKYAQVVVRDFVSGAMENTTATVFGEFMNRTPRQMLDGDDENIIAHELAHHWFGNLVTCESWPQLALNESFATYSEYLWAEHAYNKYKAGEHIYGKLRDYLQEGNYEPKKVVRHYYHHRDLMFDAHSYNKGALILHYLRNIVGDEAFFEALRIYLEKFAWKTAEIHDLRLVFEEVTGQDLNWFFNPWFMQAGHPKLKVESKYSDSLKTVELTVQQQQDTLISTLFRLPLAVDIHSAGKTTRHPIVLSRQMQKFRFPVSQEPDLVLLDAENVLPGTIATYHSKNEQIFKYRNYDNFHQKFDALRNLQYYKNDSVVLAVFNLAIQHPFDKIAAYAIRNYPQTNWQKNQTFIDKLSQISKTHLSGNVRSTALYKLASLQDKSLIPLYRGVVRNDSSYMALSAAFDAIIATDSVLSLQLADSLQHEKFLLNSTLTAYQKYGDAHKIAFFEKAFQKYSGYEKYQIINAYTTFVIRHTETEIQQSIEFLSTIARNNPEIWLRKSAVVQLKTLAEHLEQNSPQSTVYPNLKIRIQEIINQETDPDLYDWYHKFI